MKIGLNIGHYGTVGAEGILSEVKCNTEIYGKLLPMLKQAGHEVIPCNDATPQDYVSATKLANRHELDIVISLHCNSHANKSANGTEVMYYEGNAATRDIAEKISAGVCGRISTKNRGSVPRKDLYILTHTKANAVLVECFFVSNGEDCSKYDAQRIALGIAEYFGYKEDAKAADKYSYDGTVNNMISDGVTTAENMQYWEKVLDGREPVNLDFLRTVLGRYSEKVRERN